MLELLIEGPDPRQRIRLALEAGRRYVLGRSPDVAIPVAWDARISSRHLELAVEEGRIVCTRLPSARNPVFVQGTEVETGPLEPGQHLVVGATCIQLLESQRAPDSPEPPPLGEVAFSRQALQGIRYRDADKRIEVLSRLPAMISSARDDAELFVHLTSLLLAGVSPAESAAIVAWRDGEVQILQWDRRRETAGPFRPSVKLVREAIARRGQSVLHVWEQQAASTYTASGDCDWAFCTPVLGTATAGWGLYLAGRQAHVLSANGVLQASTDSLQAEVKFVELVAEIVGSLRQLRALETQQAGLRQFFSPAVLSALGTNFDADLLTPRECEVTILFCDLRGFSRRAEESRDDLLGLLDRVSQAMTVMTRRILAHGGGVGDFLGDAALGFWGWPVSDPESPLNACQAALGIQADFEKLRGLADHPLADFQMGIGVAHGRAVAGKIGSQDQVKVTVFGPVVNLAARLEGMTKTLRVPIVLDENVAEIARTRLDPRLGRTRRLARVLPFGLETPLTVSELVPPAGDAAALTDPQLATYDQAVAAFIAGRWEESYAALHSLPAFDRAQDFLALQIAQHNRIAPPGWDGVIRLTK